MSRLLLQFGGLDLLIGGQVVGTRDQRTLQGLLFGDVGQGPVRDAADQLDLLMHGKSEDAQQSDALLGEIVVGLDEILAANLQFDAGAESIDLGIEAGVFAVLASCCKASAVFNSAVAAST